MQLHGTHIRKGGWSQGKDLSFYLKNVKKKSKLKPHRGSEDKSKHDHPLLYVIWWLLIVLRIKRKFPTCPLCSAMVWHQPVSFNLSLSLPTSLPQVCCPHTLNLTKFLHAPRLLYYIIQGANSSVPSSSSKFILILKFQLNNPFLEKGFLHLMY